MSPSALCRSGLCHHQAYVIRDYVAFVICRIGYSAVGANVVRDSVVWVYVVRVYVVRDYAIRDYIVWYNVRVSVHQRTM